ncbi:MAG: hypothetical protein ACK5XN_30165 [Bacteroidota bacterium]|jgi:hypothetical protein
MDRVEAFMEEFLAETQPHPFSPRIRLHGPGVVLLEVCKFAGTVRLGSIQSNMEPGMGHASRTLDWLLRLADKHRVEISGFVEPFGTRDGRLKVRALLAWYKRHGFQTLPNRTITGTKIVYRGKEN